MRTLQIFAAILFLGTLRIDGQTIQLTDGNSATPWVAVGHSQSAVAWQQDTAVVQAAVLDRNGSIVNARIEIGSALPAANPRAAAAGDTFLVAWQDVTPQGTMLVRAALFNASGVVQPPFTVSSGLWQQRDIVVAEGSGRFVVLWNDGLATRGAWINTAGVVESTFDLAGSGIVTDAVVSGDRLLAVWNSTAPDPGSAGDLIIGVTAIGPGTSEISRRIATMSGQGGFGAPFLGGASIAASSSGFYAAWHSGRSGREDVIEGTRISTDLVPLDVDRSKADGHHAGATGIQTDYSSILKSMIRVSSAGDRFLVSWIQSNPVSDRVRARFVESSGLASGSVSFPQPPPVSAPNDTVATGTTTLLQNGAPVAAWTTASGKLFVRVVGGGSRLRAVRR